jgi:hypothetical protein
LWQEKISTIYKIKMNMLLVLLVKAKMDFAICYRELATWFSLPLPLVLLISLICVPCKSMALVSTLKMARRIGKRETSYTILLLAKHV